MTVWPLHDEFTLNQITVLSERYLTSKSVYVCSVPSMGIPVRKMRLSRRDLIFIIWILSYLFLIPSFFCKNSQKSILGEFIVSSISYTCGSHAPCNTFYTKLYYEEVLTVPIPGTMAFISKCSDVTTCYSHWNRLPFHFLLLFIFLSGTLDFEHWCWKTWHLWFSSASEGWMLTFRMLQ